MDYPLWHHKRLIPITVGSKTPTKRESSLQPLLGGTIDHCAAAVPCTSNAFNAFFFHFDHFHCHANTLFLMQQCSMTWARQEKWHTIKVTDAVFSCLTKSSQIRPHEMKSKNTRDCDVIHTSSHEITYDKKIRNKTDVIILGVCSKLNAIPRWKVLFS